MQDRTFRRISVIGLGYIGLPTAAMFASRKIEVVGVDVNPRAVDTINRGEIHIVEPDLDMVVHAAVKEGYLRATMAVEPAEAFLIAVPTPFRGEKHEPDLSYVEAASAAIAPVLAPGNLVILESTSPVGATEAMAGWLAEARPDLTFPQTHGDASDIRIAHCPERVLPGKVMQELISNDRVIGGMTRACSELAVRLYRTFVTGDCVVASSPRVAEMCKLTENSFRDVNIAFANELSIICDKLDVDVWELIRLANRHPRVNILQPGPGVGGHCIAVDPWFIVSSAPDEARLIRTAREVNDAKPVWVLSKVREAIGTYLMENPGKTAADVSLAIYGLTFKPDIDDMRESPALAIARRLVSDHPGPVLVVEPNIASLPVSLQSAMLEDDWPNAADVHVMLVDHSSFKGRSRPKGHLIDARGIWANLKCP
ncbi:UDP-N-acetyl-D-mannosamine dehydrogenase [Antarctobacter heliothermus]|uniref:UDP-N-acetyl-D-mannosaminuronic acid dehydrogenase n=1 Tax=Antarctobacter heliothermus TaxID=74033 RepID=A0A239DA85_9RHOB|nr:UDP-N-acetyl-D-mannosamine dehydrogenase [Antarctobacter heliothermus]SNS28784.1 UDP-N-acetyl-D-mannosaminuronic acid dehydrogenase [Antarctobacter heliothermus]